MLSLCPACESELVEIRTKRVCPFCHIIVETCCDGGECRPTPTAATGWKAFVAAHEPAREDHRAKQALVTPESPITTEST